jgi:hypothetical protein
MKIERDYPGLCDETTPAGNRRWRVRVDGEKRRKINLPKGITPDHEDFDAYYDAARVGQKLKKAPPKKVRRGTLDELRERYVDAMDTMVDGGSLNNTTRSGRDRGLKQACDVKKRGVRFGTLSAELPEEAFMAILDSFGTRTGAAETCLKAMKAAFKWGEKRGFPKGSPVHLISTPHTYRGGAVPWTEDDEVKFLAQHRPGTMARLWFWLARNMAGRIGDTHVIGPQNIIRENGRAYLAWQPKKRAPSRFVFRSCSNSPKICRSVSDIQIHSSRPNMVVRLQAPDPSTIACESGSSRLASAQR